MSHEQSNKARVPSIWSIGPYVVGALFFVCAWYLAQTPIPEASYNEILNALIFGSIAGSQEPESYYVLLLLFESLLLVFVLRKVRLKVVWLILLALYALMLVPFIDFI